MQHSKALRTVISVILLAGTGLATEAHAQTTMPTTTVYGTAPTTMPTTTVYGTVPDGGGWNGGSYGGGFGGVGGAPTTVDEEPFGGYEDPICDGIFVSAANAGCLLSSPPTLVRNGCGSSGTGALVPDFVLGWSHKGEVLRGACDKHDVCYGTYGTDKHGCDRALRTDMITQCQLRIGGPNPRIVADQEFLRDCEAQADLYSSGLQGWLVEVVVSLPAFNTAQDGGFCRYLTDDARNNQCL